MTVGEPPSITATTLLVVPRSIPMVFDMTAPQLFQALSSDPKRGAIEEG
jgi:hypothetical protein